MIPTKDGGGQLDSNPCSRVSGKEFSQVSRYEALALDTDDTFALLAQLSQPEYELGLLVATCGFRISEALGLRWQDILWDRRMISIRQSFVHSEIQDGAKTKLSRSRVEVPQLVLDVLQAWRKESIYAKDSDYVFASYTKKGKQPRSASMLVEDYIRPAAIRAGILSERDGKHSARKGTRSLTRHVFDGRGTQPGRSASCHAPRKNGHDVVLQP